MYMTHMVLLCILSFKLQVACYVAMECVVVTISGLLTACAYLRSYNITSNNYYYYCYYYYSIVLATYVLLVVH